MIPEVLAAAERLAIEPTESTKHMLLAERTAGIAQMLTDLERLARHNGCISAAWALEKLLSPDQPASDETGWLIERYFNSELRYFVGTHAGWRGFLPDANRAIRFVREQDAVYILSWLLGGNGRAVQHIWAPIPLPPPPTRGER